MFNLSRIARKFSAFIRIILDFDEEEKKFWIIRIFLVRIDECSSVEFILPLHRKKHFLFSFVLVSEKKIRFCTREFIPRFVRNILYRVNLIFEIKLRWSDSKFD